jgi:hypothetical protein
VPQGRIEFEFPIINQIITRRFVAVRRVNFVVKFDRPKGCGLAVDKL